MNNPRGDVFYQTYQEAVIGVAEDAVAYNEVLGSDWAHHQQRSGLIVPRYLAGLALEVEARLRQNYFDIYEEGWMVNPRTEELLGDLGLLVGIAGIRDARSIVTARAMHDNGSFDTLGMKTIAYSARLLKGVLKIAASNPRLIQEFVEQHSIDPSINNALLVSADHIIYRQMKYCPKLLDAVDAVDHASSPSAKKAMRVALDEKLLRYAVKKRNVGYAEGADAIEEFSSSPSAREAMLGYLALRAAGADRRSVYKTGYKPRITRDLSQERIRRKENERTAQRERDRQERMRQDEERRQQRIRDRARSGGRQTGTNEDIRDILFRLTGSPSFALILAHAPRQAVSTLQSIGQVEVMRVVEEAKALRNDQPGITDRDIYLYFHGLTQGLDSAAEDLSAVKVLGLLLGGNFSKGTKLPF